MSDITVLKATQLWLNEGLAVALATVAKTWGSAPRRAGAILAVCEDGRFAGSVSGGCVEADVIAAAQDVIQSSTPKLLTFGVTNDQAWQAGLSCGGEIHIFIEPVMIRS